MFNEEAASAGSVMVSGAPTAAPDMRVFDATRLMLKKRVRALPVVDDRGRLLGVITEQDCVKALVSAVHHQTPPSAVADVMTRDPVTIHQGASLMDVAHMFHQYAVSLLPVLDGDRCVGVVQRDACLRHAVQVWEQAPDRSAAILYLSALGRSAPV